MLRSVIVCLVCGLGASVHAAPLRHAAPVPPAPPMAALHAEPAAREIAARREAFLRTPGPRQVAQLVAPGGIGSLEDGLLGKRGARDEDALERFLREAMGAADPLVAARARYELGVLLDRRGDWAGAAAVRAPLGLVGEVGLVVGPFANDPGAERTAESTLPCEPAILSAVVAKDATWASGIGDGAARLRVLPSAADAGLAASSLAGGAIPLGALLRPETQLAAYLVFGVHSDAARTAALRVGATGAVAVWLNGRRIGGRVGDRALALDADAYAAPLVVGDNRFVVRIAAGDRQPELLLRLTELDGRALPAPTAVDPAKLVAEVAPRPGVARGTPRTLRHALDVVARRDPAARLDRDAYVVFDGLDGPQPDEACTSAGPRTQRTAELAYACAEDADGRRRALEARLAETGPTAPDPMERVGLLTRLATLALRGRTEARGEELLRQAITQGDEVSAADAIIRRADLLADRGLPTVAWRSLDAIVGKLSTRRAREALAQLAERTGRRATAEQLFASLLEERPGDMSYRRQLAALERGRGTRDEMQRALERLRVVSALSDVEASAEERADLQVGLGRPDDALATLASLHALIPDEARVEERTGRLLLSLGRRGDALPHLNAALELRPQSPELRSLLAEIDPARTAGADLWRRWRVDVAGLRAEAARDPIGRGEPSRVLYDGETVRVHDNGLQDSFVERVVEIGDRRGAEREGQVDIRYSPSTQTVEVRLARVYKSNGDVVDASTIEERDLSEPWYGLYYDVKAEEVGLPALEPGDVLHVAYTVSDHGRRNELGESFGDLHMLQEETARMRSVYRLIAPTRKKLYFNQPRVALAGGSGAAVTPSVVEEGGERRYEFVAHDVPAIHAEPSMPGATELGAYVHASTFTSWAEVAAFYRTLLQPQLETDVEIRRAAQAAVRGKKTLEEKVAAIYGLVVSSTRYVGLEFGVHGYQPYRVTQVYARRFGDCKDKASLLVAMLREVGVPSTVILLRTRREGSVAPEPASLATFDHAIAYVPALDRYLDGTAEFSGSTELPSEDQGAAALHVDEGVLELTPIGGPDAALTDIAIDVKLAADGSAEVRDRRDVRGPAAEAWRRYYQAPGEWKDHYESVWAERSPGAVVRSVELPHLADREQPVEVDAQLRLPALARVDGGELTMPVLAREPRLLSSFGRLSTREHDLELPQAETDVERLHVELPRGAEPRLPAPAQLSSPFGSFSLTSRVGEDGAVDIEARTVLATRRVSAADYPAFRRFLAAVDRVVGGALRVELPK